MYGQVDVKVVVTMANVIAMQGIQVGVLRQGNVIPDVPKASCFV